MSELSNIVIQKYKTSIFNTDGSLRTTIPTNSFIETIVNTWVGKTNSLNFYLSLPTGCKGFYTNSVYKVFVIEQPPAWHNIKINGTLRTLNNAMREEMESKMRMPIKRKNIFRIYFPYMVFVIAFHETPSNHGFSLKAFCRPAPLSSLKDQLFVLPLPNFYSDQTICMPPYYVSEAGNYNNACNNLINNFWGSVYNSDITNNIIYSNIDEAPQNYYMWEKISHDNPLAASMLGFVPCPQNLQSIFETYQNNECEENSDIYQRILGSTFNCFDGETVTKSEIFKNVSEFYTYKILGYTTSRCFSSKYGECVLKINDEFDMNDKSYKVINFSRDKANSNNCYVICSSIENPEHTTIFSESTIQENINDIYLSIMDKEKRLIKKTKVFDLVLKSGDVIVFKPTNNSPYFILKTISHFTRDIYENLILVTTDGEQFDLQSIGKNIHKINKQTKIKINGIPVTTRTHLLKFDINSNGMLTSYPNNDYNCTCTDIDKLKIEYLAQIHFKNINLSNDCTITFNLMGAENNYLLLRSSMKMFLTKKIINEGLPIKYLANRTKVRKSTKRGDVLICNVEGKEYIVKLSKFSDNLEYFSFDEQVKNGIIIADQHEIDDFKRYYKIGDKVIITKLYNYVLEDGTIYTIDSFSSDEDKQSLIVNLVSEDQQKVSLPLIDNNFGFNRFIIRKAVSEHGGLKVGDAVTRNSLPFKRPHIAKKYRYIIKAIVTDCGNDPLVIFENGISLYFSDVANYFDIVSVDDSDLRVPAIINSSNDFCIYHPESSLYTCINIVNGAEYGIPRPSLYKYEKSFVDYKESIYYSNLKRGEKYV